MKKNITILIGVVVLVAILYMTSTSNKEKRPEAGVSDVRVETVMKQVVGEVIRQFEGDHMLEYTLSVPDIASTSVDMDGALIRVMDGENLLATVYMSYEGGRGYSPLDYIDNVITPHVSVITPMNISTVGSYDWQVAESDGSEWHIASVANGQWLVVIENKKASHDVAQEIISKVSVR